MKATHQIVKLNIKNVYAEKNKGVYVLLKNFTNFFTLNFDSFLYLLLLNYKPHGYKIDSIAFQPTIEFIEEDLNTQQNDIFRYIKYARREGKLELSVDNSKDKIEKDFKNLTKTHFVTEIKEIAKAEGFGWKDADIKRVVKYVFEQEKNDYYLSKVDDGSRQMTLFKDEFFFDNDKQTKNLFFLHGAFHIYRDGVLEKKITKSTDKALYDRLESILNDEEQEIVCIFQSENKVDEINNSEYLKNNLQKLKELSGNMVIIGSSLSENDNHIFERINESHIKTIYISTTAETKEEIMTAAQKVFPEKNTLFFNARSISYDLPEENDEIINE